MFISIIINLLYNIVKQLNKKGCPILSSIFCGLKTHAQEKKSYQIKRCASCQSCEFISLVNKKTRAF
ncbi:MAG: hypothetical protein A2096_09160 [Spirochaetes bacterium GWF1_41_5]|nr:MAG: hypothetical protein A2096_09160 [Spirochaetes bacterium GWF1_41_5]